LTEPPPDIADHRDDAEPELVELLLELLAKEAESRPPTAKAVARRLDAMLATIELGGGGVDTAEFLSERFAQVRARTRAAVAEAVERARDAALSTDTTTSVGFELGAVPRARPARSAVVFSLVGLVAASAIAYVLLRGAGTSPVTRAGTVSPMPAATNAATARTTSPPNLAATEGAPAPSVSGEAENATKGRKGAVTPAPRRRERPSKSGGVPLWEQY
jgi:hypothetical protein